MSKQCQLCSAENASEAKYCSFCGSPFKERVGSYDAFISYRRDGGHALAALLKVHLERNFNKHVYMDTEELEVGRFDEELLETIGRTPNFILILTKDCLARCAQKHDWLKREIMHALQTGRNVIPVMTDGFAFPGQSEVELLPEAMRVLPSLQAVAWSSAHLESSVRKTAQYLVPSVPSRNSGVSALAPPGLKKASIGGFLADSSANATDISLGNRHGPEPSEELSRVVGNAPGKTPETATAVSALTPRSLQMVAPGREEEGRLLKKEGGLLPYSHDDERLDGEMAPHKEEERLCREIGNKDGLRRSLGNQGLILKARGDMDGAMALHKEEERLCRELGNKDGLQSSLGNQGLILYGRGDMDSAMALYKEQERLCRELGNNDGLQVSLGNQGLILKARGDMDGAMALHKEEGRLCREIGNKDGLQRSLGNQARIQKQHGLPLSTARL